MLGIFFELPMVKSRNYTIEIAVTINSPDPACDIHTITQCRLQLSSTLPVKRPWSQVVPVASEKKWQSPLQKPGLI